VRLRRKTEVKKMSFEIFRKTEGEREKKGELRLGSEVVEWEEKWRKSREDCSTKQEQYDVKTYLWFWSENYLKED
jgi:hypothetical protein